MRRRIAALVTLVGGVVACPPSEAQQESNQTFTFQARVTNSGTPINSDGITLTFEIYDAQSAGNKLWDETVSNVVVKDGFLCVELGASASDPLGKTFTESAPSATSRNRYMAIKSGSVDLVVPRVKLTATPMAINAEMAAAIDDGTGAALTITQLDTRYSVAAAISDGSGGSVDLSGLDTRHAMATSINDGSGNPLDIDDLDDRYSGGGATLPGYSAGRISVSSSDPAPDSASGSSVYFHRFGGKLVSLYYDSEWRSYEISSTSPYVSLSGQTSYKLYDIFATPNSTSGFYISYEAWDTSSARQSGSSVGIEQFDGVWVKKGGTTARSRYLGTVYYDSGDVTDSPTKRDVWNLDNQVDRVGWIVDTSSWGSNYSTSYTEISYTVRLTFVLGLPAHVSFAGRHESGSNGDYHFKPLRIGLGYKDSSTGSATALTTGTLNDDENTASDNSDLYDSVSTEAKVTEGRRYSTLMWSLDSNWGYQQESMGDMKNRFVIRN